MPLKKLQPQQVIQLLLWIPDSNRMLEVMRKML